ncbi:hypothetical protein [Lentilactobacillus buchneri]|uniref:hypothetical protein n=1 Tax=Lentilactobacillus buchneri TaxID=1581 RepID=UPI0011ED9BB1|nr:hypothetical protein [Lentilactobacillus buchneri]
MPATWGKNTLTNQALTMMNQALGISAITFTKAVTITDDITGDSVSQLQALTSVNYKQSRTPKAIATQDNKSRLGVTIDNSDVNEDYTYYGVGLYAKQNSTNQEVLFSVIPLTAGATMIAKENNATTASIYLDLYTDIVRGTQVTIMVSNSGTLSREDVQQMISQSIGNALNYPNETASIGTDLDTILDISITRIINDTTVVHAPSGFSGTGYLITIGSGDKTVPIVHTLDDTINNIRSTRYFNSTTNVWSEWNAYAKTVDVNQQLDKKVNIADMRKPASDVAGIEEVNAKQDKIGYTPADDSKVVHTTDAPSSIIRALLDTGTDLNTVQNPGIFPFNGCTFVNDIDTTTKWGAIVNNVLPNEVIRQEMIQSFGTIYGYRHYNGGNNTWSSWVIPADDSKVAHLSGANNFDTTPTVNNNPLLLASSLPSDLARLSQDANFTAKLQQNGQDVALANNTIYRNPNTGTVSETNTFTASQTFSIAPVINDASTSKGDNQAATMADLKSVENSAWRVITSSNGSLSSITFL